MTLPSATQAQFAALLEQRTGQHVSPARNWRIEAALRPIMRDLAIPTLEVLSARIVAGDTALGTRAIEALLNNETSFFRDMAMFDLLDRAVLPALAELRGGRRLRIWSAGCSTGQEAYSLAMLLTDSVQSRDRHYAADIMATDVSTTVVTRARRGVYSQFEIQRGLPVRTMLRWFVQSGEDWAIDPRLKRMVRFGAHNLLDVAPGRFDLILCRNLLMYLKPEARSRAFERLAAALDSGGVLMLGAGETVIGQTDRFRAHPEWRGLYAAQPLATERRAA